MAGVGEGDLPVVGVDDGVEERQVHLGRLELGDERAVNAAEDLARRLLVRGVDGRRAHGERHDERGREAVARDVADHHPDPAAGETEEVIEVAAHRFGGNAARRHLRQPTELPERREELELEVVGELHLAHQPLLPKARRHQPAVLHRRADLAGDGADQLLVAGGEAFAAGQPTQVDDPDGAALPLGRRIADRDGKEGRAGIRERRGDAAARELVVRLEDDGASLAEDRGGDGVVIRDEYRPALAGHPDRGHQVELVALGVVEPERRALDAERPRDLGKDRSRRGFQRDHRSEDLADGVEQRDFLVALRELAAEEARLRLLLEQAGDDEGEEGGERLDLVAGPLQLETDLEIRSRRDEVGVLGRLVPVRRSARSRELPGGSRGTHPEPRAAPVRPAERFQHLAYDRRNERGRTEGGGQRGKGG